MTRRRRRLLRYRFAPGGAGWLGGPVSWWETIVGAMIANVAGHLAGVDVPANGPYYPDGGRA